MANPDPNIVRYAPGNAKARSPIHYCTFSLLLMFFLFASSQRGNCQSNMKVIQIRLEAIAGLQFDRVRFVVRPGAQVKVTLVNSDDMSHNLVFTKPGTRLDVVEAALKLEEKGPEKNYIPDSPDVLWTIPVLSPGEEGSVTFTAPAKTGIYPYVCTFPGHGFYMYGAMYVASGDTLPDAKDDKNIPPARQKDNSDKTHAAHGAGEQRNHPFEQKPPYLYRAYMEDSGPASIAVHLPHNLSYCWDAGACALRYAWEGGFVDNSGLWKGKPNAVAKISGSVFYRSKVLHQLRIGDPARVPVTDFKGYRLVNRYPEFHYTVDGVDVYELIQPADDGSGLVRNFRIPSAGNTIWLRVHPDDGVVYQSTAGETRNNLLMVPAEEAANFSIVMTKSKE